MATRAREIACPHRPPCGACPRFNREGLSAIARGLLEDLARRHGVNRIDTVSGSHHSFRERARLAIRGRLRSPKIGLFETGTHRVVHIPHCSVQHPLINRAAAAVRRALVDTRSTSYSEQAHAGLARYLQVVVERSSQTAQIVLVGNCPSAEPLRETLEAIRAGLGRELHSLWFNSNQERTNGILGARFEHWCGAPSVVERFGGAAVHYPPGAFGQSNLEIAQLIIEHVRTEVPAGSSVVELYAGVGAIGLSLLERAARLWLNEVNAHSLEGMAMGLAQLEPAERAKIAVVAGSAQSAAALVDHADVVIADPPRKGLDAGVAIPMILNPPARLLYISCDPESLRKDADRLTSSGKMRLTGLKAFNLQPFTHHVETVARFERS